MYSSMGISILTHDMAVLDYTSKISLFPHILGICALFVAVLALRWYRWLTRFSISNIRGPPVKSMLMGMCTHCKIRPLLTYHSQEMYATSCTKRTLGTSTSLT